MRRRRYGPIFKIKLKKKTAISILAISCFLSALFFILALFGPTKVRILVLIKKNLLEIFGWISFFLPFILVSFGLLILRLRLQIASPNVVFGAALTALALAALTAPFSASWAGIFGTQLWISSSEIITGVGSFFLFFAVLTIGLVILFNTSVDQVILIATQTIQGTILFVKKYLFRNWFSVKKPVFIQEKLPLQVRESRSASSANKNKSDDRQDLGLGTTLVSNLPGNGQIWEYPPLSLLSDEQSTKADRGDPKQNAQKIEQTLDSFGVSARVVEVNCGPAVTQYALEIALGTKLSKIAALQNDLALALATRTGTVRIEAPIPGKSLVGIEVPNRSLEVVSLKNVLVSEAMRTHKSKLAVALGLDVSGSPVVADITKMPHVLIAGTTGSGKSICINSFIASLLFRNSPQELKLILVDPKRVELSVYADIPHLLTPIIVDVEKTLSALNWALSEMDRRYKLFAASGVRNIAGYNEMSGFQALPYIVIFIDELADLMAFAAVAVEDAICRLAQMARATGIHLVLSTQRPSVDVITGLLKANIPCRIAFNVSSMIDSRVIIDQPGAEKLLGRGDMLYVPPDMARPSRIQGAFIEKEITALVDYLKKSGVTPEYTQEVTEMTYVKAKQQNSEGQDALFEEAVRTVCQYDRASASLLQRRLSIGYARAARIIDQLESAGIVGAGEGAKPRDVLVRNPEEFLTAYNNKEGQSATNLD